MNDYNRAISLNRKYSDAYLNKGVLCEKIGSLEEAKKAFSLFVNYSKADDKNIDYVRNRLAKLSKRKI